MPDAVSLIVDEVDPDVAVAPDAAGAGAGVGVTGAGATGATAAVVSTAAAVSVFSFETVHPPMTSAEIVSAIDASLKLLMTFLS
jgi:hypothetical protein